MKTVCIQIGNSDDKLSQKRWAAYVRSVDDITAEHECERHFFGGSLNWQPWQNACWVVAVDNNNLVEFLARLAATGTKYNQDSVAVTVGETQFI